MGAERIAVRNLVSGNPTPNRPYITAVSGFSTINNEANCRNGEPAIAVSSDSNQVSGQFACVEYGQVDASQQLCGTPNAPIPLPNNNPNTLNAGNDQLNSGDRYGLNTSAVDYNPHNPAYNNPQDLAAFAFLNYLDPQDLVTLAFDYNNPQFNYNNPYNLATSAFDSNTTYNQP